jgi:hypothetical protein
MQGLDFALLMGRPDTRHVFVDVGLGFHVQLTLAEAVAFTDEKEAQLTKYVHWGCPSFVQLIIVLHCIICRAADALTRSAAVVGSHLRTVTEGLDQLLDLEPDS